MGKPRYNIKNNTDTLPESNTRYFAILKPADKKDKRYLLVSFQYLDERNTFVSNTVFETLPAAKLSGIKKDVVFASRNNSRVVFNQDAKPVKRIASLYKPLSQQKIDRPEDSCMKQPTGYSGSLHKPKCYRQ